MDRPRQRVAQSGYRLALIALLCCPLLLGQFRTDVHWARVEVRAVDGRQKPLAGLGAEDFAVTENGVAQKVEAVSQVDLPLDLVLVVDVSGSMEKSVAAVAQSAHEALAAMRPGDRVAVMTFNRRHKWRLKLSGDRQDVEEALREVADPGEFGGGTVLNTPVLHAAKYLQKQSATERRRAILMITDGHGMRGETTKRVLRELWESDTTVNCLMVETMRGYRRRYGGRRQRAAFLYSTNGDVQELAEKTGGEVLYFADVTKPFTEMLDRIRQRYTVFYRPLEAEKKTRKVLVGLSETGRARHAEASVVGRREYSVP